MIGNLFVIAAPSGAGKTSLVNALVEKTPDICISVSHTTRKPREGEIEGRDYHFVSQQKFDEMRDQGLFIESATVFDNSYGTAFEAVRQKLVQGLDVIMEIDWQGAEQVRHAFPEVTSIFIIPPSKETLLERLRSRGEDNEDVIQRRMCDAGNEISHYVEFDFLIVNDDFDKALQTLNAITIATRQQVELQEQQHADLLSRLLA